jgi:hypothetical protein
MKTILTVMQSPYWGRQQLSKTSRKEVAEKAQILGYQFRCAYYKAHHRDSEEFLTVDVITTLGTFTDCRFMVDQNGQPACLETLLFEGFNHFCPNHRVRVINQYV